MPFGRRKEEKQKKQLENLIKLYHLDELDQKDLKSVMEISKDLMGMGLAKGLGRLTFPTVEVVKIQYLSALVRQNFMIIRKLNEILKK